MTKRNMAIYHWVSNIEESLLKTHKVVFTKWGFLGRVDDMQRGNPKERNKEIRFPCCQIYGVASSSSWSKSIYVILKRASQEFDPPPSQLPRLLPIALNLLLLFLGTKVYVILVYSDLILLKMFAFGNLQSQFQSTNCT